MHWPIDYSWFFCKWRKSLSFCKNFIPTRIGPFPLSIKVLICAYECSFLQCSFLQTKVLNQISFDFELQQKDLNTVLRELCWSHNAITGSWHFWEKSRLPWSRVKQPWPWATREIKTTTSHLQRGWTWVFKCSFPLKWGAPVLTEFYYDAGALSVSHGLSSLSLSLSRYAGGEEFIIPFVIVS